jgi:hypothetical protein
MEPLNLNQNDAFQVLVEEFIREFATYTTVLSLRGMTDKLAELPIELKQKHSDHYNSITGVIISYGKESKPLTLHQSRKLMRILRCEDDNKITRPCHYNIKFMSNAEYDSTYAKNEINQINQINEPGKQNQYGISHIAANPRITKLSQDDVLYEIMRSLQQELMGNFSSGMTNPVANFFESCELILGLYQDAPSVQQKELILENEQKYDTIMKDVKTHFISCGWKMKDATTLGGFQTAPDTTKIINGLVRIMDAYF